jgi:hypothetical protein
MRTILLGLLLGLVSCQGGSVDAVAPTLTLTPSTPTVTAAGTLTLSASASDAVGVERIGFFAGSGCTSKLDEKRFEPTQTLAQASHVPALSAADNGNVQYSARAFDAAGNGSSCASALVSVNIPPNGSFLKVSIDRSVIGDSNQAIDVKLNGPGYNNQALSQTQTFEVQPGSYSVSAGIVASRYTPSVTGSPALVQTGQTKEISVVYSDDAQKPTVSLQPSGSVSVTAPGPVALQASASDNIAVARVELYLGSNKVAEDSSPPYEFSTQSFAAIQSGQSFIYQAKALDFAGNVSDASSTTFVVSIQPLQQIGGEIALGRVADAGLGQLGLVVAGGNHFLTYTASNTDNSSDLLVRKLSGSSWVLEGTALGSSGSSAQAPSIGGSQPYVAFSEFYANDRVYVKRLNAGSWEGVGGSLNQNPANNAQQAKLAIRNNQPVVAFSEHSPGSPQDVLVKEWTGSLWQALDGVAGGLRVNAGIESSSPAIGVTGSGQVVVAYLESLKTVRVKRWDGSSWQSLGTGLNLDPARKADSPALAVKGSEMVVAFVEQNANGKFQLQVKRWDQAGSQWQLLSATGLNQNSSTSALSPKVVVDALSRISVVWIEDTLLYMKHFAGSTWDLVGSGALNLRPTFSAADPDLTLSGNNPVVAWREYSLLNQGTADFAEIYLQVKQANLN